MFGKRTDELTKRDIQRLIDEQFQEGVQLEFKETLPAKKSPDPWVSGEDRIGNYARNEIVAEVIAFANARGGSVVLGVKETRSKPARANRIVPLRDCAELAERLRLQCRDCIEPQVPILEASGVEIEDSGSGVVVIHVLGSRMAPHRHSQTKECYIRRADRTEKMTMREIQDLTIHVERGLTAIVNKFHDRQNKFANQAAEFASTVSAASALRVTALPTAPVYLDKVHKNQAVDPTLQSIPAMADGERLSNLFVPITPYNPRPILRGTKAESHEGDLYCSWELSKDGLVEYILLNGANAEERIAIHPQWVMGLICNAILAVERFRHEADTPDLEYALEVALIAYHRPIKISLYGGTLVDSFRQGRLPVGEILFPRYSIGPRSEFSSLASLIERDFWNACGSDWNTDTVVDFDSVMPPANNPHDDG